MYFIVITDTFANFKKTIPLTTPEPELRHQHRNCRTRFHIFKRCPLTELKPQRGMKLPPQNILRVWDRHAVISVGLIVSRVVLGLRGFKLSRRLEYLSVRLTAYTTQQNVGTTAESTQFLNCFRFCKGFIYIYTEFNKFLKYVLNVSKSNANILISVK